MNMNPDEILATIKKRKAEIKLMSNHLDDLMLEDNFVVFLNNAHNLGMQAYLNVIKNDAETETSEFAFDATIFSTPKYAQNVASEIVQFMKQDGMSCSVGNLKDCMVRELELCEKLIYQGEQYANQS